MLKSLASAAFPRALTAGGISQFVKLASSASAAAAFARHDRSYAVVPPTRTSHQEVLEHLGRMFNFEGKVAFVSGAAGGLGSRTALAFARYGRSVLSETATLIMDSHHVAFSKQMYPAHASETQSRRLTPD